MKCGNTGFCNSLCKANIPLLMQYLDVSVFCLQWQLFSLLVHKPGLIKSENLDYFTTITLY